MGEEWQKEMEEYFDNLAPGELESWVAEQEAKPKCDPQTCAGQCQGFGGCQDCIDFREEAGIVLPSLAALLDWLKDEKGEHNVD